MEFKIRVYEGRMAYIPQSVVGCLGREFVIVPESGVGVVYSVGKPLDKVLAGLAIIKESLKFTAEGEAVKNRVALK